MEFKPNTNAADCPYSVVNEGDCCCNCQNLKRAYHPILGFVGLVCNLDFGNGEVEVMPLPHKHGMCECHIRVKNDTSERLNTQGVLQIPESAVAI